MRVQVTRRESSDSVIATGKARRLTGKGLRMQPDPRFAEALPGTLTRMELPRTLPSMGGGAWTLDAARDPHKLDERHLVNRATQGLTVEELGRARQMGWEAWLEEQLQPGSIDDSEVEEVLTYLTSSGLSSWQLYHKYYLFPELQYVPAIELMAAAVVRALYSRRQLFERTVEFWTDHFNVDATEELGLIFKPVEDREVIRRHAFDTFPKLLHASAKSAAMSWYLDNYANVAGAPNENYARELMELHTLGADGPYTEDDVVAVARCFTGWTFDPADSPALGKFLFNAPNHDNGYKVVLGHPILPGGGVTDGETVLDILAYHPRTAEFIATKMCRWFLAYQPPAAIVDQVTATYLATGGNVRSMLRVILSHDSVAHANPLLHPKLRRPFHLVSSILRAGRAQVTNLGTVLVELQTMGQLPFTWPAPNGFPDSVGAWGGALRPRWSFAQRLLDGGLPGVSIDAHELLHGDGDVPRAFVAERVDKVFTGGSLSATDRALLQQFVNAFPALDPQVERDAFSLAAASPSYQYY